MISFIFVKIKAIMKEIEIYEFRMKCLEIAQNFILSSKNNILEGSMFTEIDENGNINFTKCITDMAKSFENYIWSGEEILKN